MEGGRIVGYVLGVMLGLALIALLLPWLWLPAIVFLVLGAIVLAIRRGNASHPDVR